MALVPWFPWHLVMPRLPWSRGPVVPVVSLWCRGCCGPVVPWFPWSFCGAVVPIVVVVPWSRGPLWPCGVVVAVVPWSRGSRGSWWPCGAVVVNHHESCMFPWPRFACRGPVVPLFPWSFVFCGGLVGASVISHFAQPLTVINTIRGASLFSWLWLL